MKKFRLIFGLIGEHNNIVEFIGIEPNHLKFDIEYRDFNLKKRKEK